MRGVCIIFIFMNSQTKLLVGLAALVLFGAGLWFAGALPFGGTANPPSLDRPVTTPADFSPEARATFEQNVATLKERIRINPEASDGWLDLAIYYKTANDLDGAVDIWKYLAEGKQNVVAYYNLGNVHHLYLKDYGNSEKYYKEAIQLGPSTALNYIGLHELYRYSYKQDSTAAADILNEGLTKVDQRGRVDLFSTLGGYYKEKGDKANALDAYTKARDGARAEGNTALVIQFEREIAALQ